MTVFLDYLYLVKKKSYTIKQVQKKIEFYCVYQERCHKEVIAKLYEMGIIPLAIDQIISTLIQNDFLNETRYALSYARGKFNTKKWGKKRIIFELKKRKISDFNIKLALNEINQNEYLITLDNLSNKIISLSKGDKISKKRKLISALKYRGWETNLIYEQLEKLNF